MVMKPLFDARYAKAQDEKSTTVSYESTLVASTLQFKTLKDRKIIPTLMTYEQSTLVYHSLNLFIAHMHPSELPPDLSVGSFLKCLIHDNTSSYNHFAVVLDPAAEEIILGHSCGFLSS